MVIFNTRSASSPFPNFSAESSSMDAAKMKKNSAATELFQMMDAPSKGFDISVTDPADVTGFLHYMLEAGRRERAAC